MKVVVTHRSPVIARSLCLLLASDGNESTDLEWTNLPEFTGELGKLNPEVLLVDSQIEDLDVQELVSAVQADLKTSVSLIAVDGSPEQLAEATTAGAHGYLSLGTPIDEFLASVQLLSTGNIVATADISTTLADIASVDVEPDPAETELTKREYEIAGLIASGLTNRALASQLEVSEGTIKAHLRNIFRKIGVSNRSELTGYAHRLGII